MAKQKRQYLRSIFARVLVALVVLQAVAMSTPSAIAVGQTDYRWRNDNGTESTATYSAAQGTALTNVPRSTGERVRFSAKGDTSDFYERSKISLPYPTGGSFSADAVVVDTSGGTHYAYTAEDYYDSTRVERVAKINLTNFTYVSDINMYSSGFGEGGINAMVLDSSAGYVYAVTANDRFGGNRSTVYKISLSSFTVVGSIFLTYPNVSDGVIDTTHASHYAYFVTSAGKISKVDLNTFTEVTTIDISSDGTYGNTGNGGVQLSVIDTANGYAYFHTSQYNTASKIVKVDVNPSNTFQRIGAITLNSDEDGSAGGAVIDAANGYAYFVTEACPSTCTAKLVKVDVNPLNTFARIGAASLAKVPNPQGGAIDASSGYAYFGSYDTQTSGTAMRVDVNPANTFQQVSSFTLTDNARTNTFIDPSLGYVYFQSHNAVGHVPKVIRVTTTAKTTAQFRLEYGAKTSTCAAITTWTQVPTSAGSEHWQMHDSTNINNGDPTTDSSGVTNPASNFVAGEIHDTSSQTSSISLPTVNDFTEVEYSVEATTNATAAGSYCFRLTDAGDMLASYTTFAEATLAADPPSAIFDLAATDGENTQSTLTWSAPFDGGSAITSYAVHYSNDGFTVDDQTCSSPSCTDTTTGATVTGLTNGVTYSFQVYAINAAGTSPVSNTATGTPQAPPPPPPSGARQDSYRWRNDNGTESTATFDGAENAPLASLAQNSPERLRFGASNDGSSSGLAKIASLTFGSGEDYVHAGAVDASAGYAYFGTATTPGRVIKVRLSDFTEVGAITLNSGENSLESAVIDTANGYLYFGTDTNPGKIIKINLTSFTRVGAITLSSGQNRARTAVADLANGYAYFGIFVSPGKIVKVDINPAHTFAVVGSPVTLAGSQAYPRTSVIDNVNHFAYFGTLSNGAQTYVTKIDVDPGHSFAETGTAIDVQAAIGSTNLRSSVIDVPNGYAYFGDQTGIISKIRLSDFTLNDSLTVSGSVYLSSAVYDSASGNAYFASNCTGFQGCTGDTYVKKIDINPAHTFAETESITLSDGDGGMFAGVLDDANGYAYFGTNTSAANVVKVSVKPHVKFRLEYGLKTTSCSAVSSWTQVPAVATTEHFQMFDSTNLTNGEATTDSSGITNVNPTFAAGQAMDTSSQTDTVGVGENTSTEIEYSIEATANSTPGSDYCFRMSNEGSDLSSYSNYALATVAAAPPPSPSSNTTLNRVVLSRIAINAPSTATIYFTLSHTLSSQLTVTFDSAFTGLDASGATASTPDAPGCMTNFQNVDGHTFTADKSSCTGAVIISGVTVTNPPTAGGYLVSWVNDDPGYALVAIADSDQVTVDATVDPTITFDLNTGATNAPVSAPYSVALGALTTGAVSHSDNAGVNSVWANLDTNATGGAVVTVLSQNAALASLSVPSDTIPNSAAPMSAGTANYGLCVNSVTPPTQAAGTFQASAPYDSGTCDPAGSANAVKALSTVTPTSILDSNANPVTTGSAEILVNAAISTATAAHSDYADLLTFVATGTF